MSTYTFDPSNYSVGDGLADLPWTEERGTDHSLKEIQNDTHGNHLAVELANPTSSKNYLAFSDVDGDASRDDAEVYIDYKTTDGTGRAYALARAASAEVTQYELGSHFDDLATINKRVTDTVTGLADTGANLIATARIGIRARVTGNELKVKVWEASTLSTDPATEEPSSWTLTTTDSEITGVGDVGFFLRGGAESQKRSIYFVGVGTGGDTAPTSTAAGNLLLDHHPNAALGTSVDKIRDAYTGDLVSSTSGPVGTWFDQSGNGRDLTASGDARAEYSSGGLVFDGALTEYGRSVPSSTALTIALRVDPTDRKGEPQTLLDVDGVRVYHYDGHLYVDAQNGTDAQTSWSELGSYSESEPSSITEWNGNLYVTNRGPATVSRWNGSSWSQVGTYPGGQPHSVTVYDGTLWVADNPAPAVYRWNGSSWDAPGTYPGSGPRALAVYNGDLYVADPGSGSVYRWNGSSWDTPGSFPGTDPFALCVYNGTLVTADFTIGGVYRWNGSSWDALGSAPGTDSYSLSVYDGDLYVGNRGTDDIVRWDGSSWSTAGSWPGFNPHSLCVYDGDLYAPSDQGPIYRWDGSSWEEAGSAPAGHPVGGTVYHGKLTITDFDAPAVRQWGSGESVRASRPGGKISIVVTVNGSDLILRTGGSETVVPHSLSRSQDGHLTVGSGEGTTRDSWYGGSDEVLDGTLETVVIWPETKTQSDRADIESMLVGTVVPPALSNASASADGADGYTWSVDTDEGSGALYHVVTQSSTAPSASQVKAGQNHNGAPASASDSTSISSSGTKSGGQTGILLGGTQYWVHYMHEDSQGAQSSVASSGSFTTDASGNLLLDDHPNAAVGYSVSQLRSAYSGSLVSSTAGPVGTWFDQSGNGRDLSASGAARPEYNTAGLVFDGVEEGYERSLPSSSAFTVGLRAHPTDRDGPPQTLVDLDGIRVYEYDGLIYTEVQNGSSSSWTTLGTYPESGGINSLVAYDGTLYAGNRDTNSVSVYDGSSWGTLGTWPSGRVFSLCIYQGQLHATSHDAKETYRWDGSSWIQVGSPTQGGRAMCVQNGALWVTDPGTSTVHRWDGSTWGQPGTFTPSSPFAISTYRGQVVTADFDRDEISVWNGSSWGTLGSFPGTSPFGLSVYEGDLYVANRGSDDVHRWDGSSWSGVGTYPGSNPHGLLAYDGRLFVPSSGDSTIYAWDGASWSSVGSYSVGPDPDSLTVYEGVLHVGDHDGNVVARWGAGASAIQPHGGGELEVVVAVDGSNVVVRVDENETAVSHSVSRSQNGTLDVALSEGTTQGGWLGGGVDEIYDGRIHTAALWPTFKNQTDRADIESTLTATAPVLSNASGAPTGTTTADASVDTDTGEGTLWAVITTVDAEPSPTQIKNGNNANGSSAAGADSTSLSFTGTTNLSFSGLTDGQAYKVWFYQEDASGAGSNVVSSSGIATDVGTLASKTAQQFYPCVEWNKYVDPGEVGPSNNFDAIVDTTFTPDDGSHQTISIQWYYDGSKFGKERFTVRFAGLDVDTYSISTSSTDISPLGNLSGSVVVGARSNAPKPLRFLESDSQGRPAVRQANGTLEARDIRMTHGDWAGTVNFAPLDNNHLTSFWDGQESLYADNVVPRMNERNANMKYDHLGGQQIGGTDHDPPWSDENPHRKTFEVLDRLLDDVQSRGQDAFDFYLWLWLDGGRSDPGGFSNGYNGAEDERMQRYIAARLGPRVEVSYLAYGFDLQESASVSGSDLDTWAQNMNQWVDYPMFFSGRGYSAEDNGSSTTPENPSNDDQGWIATNLDVTAYSTSTDTSGGAPATDGMITPLIHTSSPSGVQDVLDYDNLVNEVEEQSPSKLNFHEEGYLIGRDLSAGTLGGDHVWDSEANRRWFYRSRLALWVGGSMGDGGDGNYSTADFDALQTAGTFWDNYLSLGLVRDNSIVSSAGWGVRESDNSRLIVYEEGTLGIDVDLSGVPSATYEVKAVNTKAPYSELDEGTVEGGSVHTITPGGGTSTDWILVLDRVGGERNSIMLLGT